MTGVFQLLWEPLPDQPPLPASLRSRLLRTLAADPAQGKVELRVRGGAAQAVVRTAYLAAVAEQDTARRPPDPFTQAWRDHLAALLGQDTIELPGWGPITVAGDLDTSMAWDLFEQASRARASAVRDAVVTVSRPVSRGSPRGRPSSSQSLAGTPRLAR